MTIEIISRLGHHSSGGAIEFIGSYTDFEIIANPNEVSVVSIALNVIRCDVVKDIPSYQILPMPPGSAYKSSPSEDPIYGGRDFATVGGEGFIVVGGVTDIQYQASSNPPAASLRIVLHLVGVHRTYEEACTSIMKNKIIGSDQRWRTTK